MADRKERTEKVLDHINAMLPCQIRMEIHAPIVSRSGWNRIVLVERGWQQREIAAFVNWRDANIFLDGYERALERFLPEIRT